jgi:hypothetical protein
MLYRSLVELRPVWLSTGGRRYQMGLEFDCPHHAYQMVGVIDRLRLWFQNPADGDEPAPAAVVNAELYPRRVWRTGGDLDHLTLTPTGHDPGAPIDVYQHWRGYLLEGCCYDSITFGPGW